MPNYKLTYFDVRGRGEPSRLLFKQAGVDFEDFRVARTRYSDEWAKMKSDMPFGQMPVLEVDGEVLCQSRAIELYLANKFGLGGKTDWDKARVDMICGCVEDVTLPLVKAYQEKDETRKEELRKNFKEELFPDFMTKLEKILKYNKGGDGYFVGDEVTLADFRFFCYFFLPSFADIEVNLDSFPKLAALKDRVSGLPKIAEWYAESGH